MIMRSVTTINEKMKRLGDRLIVQKNTLQCLNQECLLLKMSREQTNACIKKMKSDQDEYLHYISYDGTLIWKITNVDQKFENCYVRDDTMFIKIMLDFGETLREVLPYILSVNRGLPTHIQEAIRCMKIEKYKQAREALIAEIIRNDQEI
ncbi:unnamed protein product [Rotaria sordida]|uniref:Uncharacterized protein n=1 Tax=Rotaria sordida TaxID=392033 RepID=A0A819TAH4_9BILA|nr:unnamed protein product [Rotaria sordida]